MALLSPGVEITIIDESYYDSSTPGSVPLIVVATASNKTAPSGTGTAPMTVADKAGKLFLATSQRELVQAFGNPIFYSSGGSSLHGHELNEYGLHAAYSFLGISNQAYILRADIDTAALIPNSTAPTGVPVHGTYWFDVAATSFGVFQSNGNRVPGKAWVSKEVKVATDEDTTQQTVDTVQIFVPKSSFGVDGDFAIAVQDTNNFVFEKIAGNWYKLGSSNWKSRHPTVVRGKVSPDAMVAGDTFTITANGKTATVTCTVGAGTGVITDIEDAITTAVMSGVTASVSAGAVVITNATGGSITLGLGTGTPLNALGMVAKTYNGVRVNYTNDASYPDNSIVGDMWIKGSSTNKGADFSLKVFNATTGAWEKVAAPFFPFNSTLTDGTAGKDAAAEAAKLNGLGKVYVGYDATNGVIQFRRFNGTRFVALSYEASSSIPVTTPAAGTLWFSNDFRADIMVSNGSNYVGYLNYYPETNPAGIFVQGSVPQTQSDGTPLADNDLWIDTTDLENYPRIRRFDAEAQRWSLIDLTDQTSPFGIIFADVRQDSGVAFEGQEVNGYAYNSEKAEDMLLSDYVDPDAPDARTVPAGMLLFNTRFSTYNVKKWEPNFFGYGGWDDDTDYSMNTYTVGDHGYEFPRLADKGRWVTVSGNRQNGSPLMGRRAQRAMITKAMSEALTASDEARSEIINFNLIAAPGYPELMDEMVSLNTDQKNTAFVVGDTPSRLAPNATEIMNWAGNAYKAASNGEDGLTTSDPYVGVYYPWGLGTNVDGSEVMIPPSTMALRVMAYNDQVAYPWFAPAGFQRGLVNNANSVGYLTAEGEYQTVLLNEGLRDTLYGVNINPIAYIPNRGLVVWGQKTRSSLSTAMDRINVARLCNYMATALDGIAKPFLFQQNDQQTRDAFKASLDRFLAGLVGLRAIEDYAVQCDTDNNTRERINRSELWADIAILPMKSVEFIYIPIRLTNDTI